MFKIEIDIKNDSMKIDERGVSTDEAIAASVLFRKLSEELKLDDKVCISVSGSSAQVIKLPGSYQIEDSGDLEVLRQVYRKLSSSMIRQSVSIPDIPIKNIKRKTKRKKKAKKKAKKKRSSKRRKR